MNTYKEEITQTWGCGQILPHVCLGLIKEAESLWAAGYPATSIRILHEDVVYSVRRTTLKGTTYYEVSHA
jgi:hypothetical protein